MMSADLGCFPARVDELDNIRDALVARAIALALPDRLRATLSLILEELFLNTVHHGSADEVPIASLTLEQLPRAVQLRYEDSGRAHDPFADVARAVLAEAGAARRIGGLGVILIESLADTTHYERRAERNRITLTFAVPPAR